MDFIKRLSPNKDFVAEVEKVNSLIRYDAYLNEYRIHHLFLEYLTQKQTMLTEDEKRGVYVEAAYWCADNNHKMDAINYCEKAGDYEKIIEIVRTFQMMLPNNTALNLLEIFKRIPQDVYEKSHSLCLLHTWLLVNLGRFGEVIAELKTIVQKLEALPLSPFSCRILSGAYNNLGFTHYFNCLYDDTYDFGTYFEKSAYYNSLSERVVEKESPNCPPASLSVGPYACRVSSPAKGLIEKFTEAVAASIPHVSHTMTGRTFSFHGLDDLIKAEVAYFKSDVQSCEKFAWQSLYKAQEKGQYEIENRALFFLLRVALATGSTSQTQELLEQLELQRDRTDYADRYTIYDIVTGWYYITIKQTKHVAGWLKNGFDTSGVNFLMQGMENIVKAKYYLLEKRYSALLAFLKSQEKEYGLGAFLFGKIGTKMLEAVCRYRLKEKEESMRALEAAYWLAFPNGLDMIFIEQGNDMRTLTHFAMKNKFSLNIGIHGPWLNRIHKKSAAYAKKLAYAVSEY